MKYTLCLISLLLSFGMASAEPMIKVLSRTVVKGSGSLYLKQIVKTRDIGESLKRKIERVELGNAPEVGEKRIYSATALAEILRQIISESRSTGVQLNIPNQIVIENRGEVFDIATVSAKIKELWKEGCESCRFERLKIQLPLLSKDVIGLPWSIDYDKSLPRKNFSYRVQFLGPKGRAYWVNGQVQVKKKVMVTRRALAYQEALREGDVAFEYRDMTFANDSSPVLADIKSVVVKRALRAGEIVVHGALMRQKKIRRGDLVKAVLSEGNWRIGLTGIAQEDGYVGKNIKIRTTTTKKLLVGEVTEAGEVEVQ